MSISLKELKKNRLTPAERFVLEQIDGCVSKTDAVGNVDWCKDGKWLFQQYFRYGWLYVCNDIWVDLIKEFGLNRDEVRQLLTNLLYDYTDNGKLALVI